MGLLDKAKKLAGQALEKAEGALETVKTKTATQDEGAPPPPPPPAPAGGPGQPQFGTAYQPGMLGRPGWRERGLVDPAAILPIKERDRVGVGHATRSQIVEEPYGMGRRWSDSGRSAALYYQLYPEHRAWEPPGGKSPSTDVSGASQASLPDGRSLVFMGSGDHAVVLEVGGLDAEARAALARSVAEQLANQ